MTLCHCHRLMLGQRSHLRQVNAVWVFRARQARQESRRLREHASALQACYQYWRQRYLLVECTWCQQHLSWQSLAQPMVELPPTSHGVCPTCFATQVQELRRRRAGRPPEPG